MARDLVALARLREQERQAEVRRASLAVALAISRPATPRQPDWMGLSVVGPYRKGRRRSGRRR